MSNKGDENSWEYPSTKIETDNLGNGEGTIGKCLLEEFSSKWNLFSLAIDHSLVWIKYVSLEIFDG